MTKRLYTFGTKYLTETCKLGVAMIYGEKYYFITDRYAYWLIEDMDPQAGSFALKVWDKARLKKQKRRPSHARKIVRQ